MWLVVGGRQFSFALSVVGLLSSLSACGTDEVTFASDEAINNATPGQGDAGRPAGEQAFDAATLVASEAAPAKVDGGSDAGLAPRTDTTRLPDAAGSLVTDGAVAYPPSDADEAVLRCTDLPWSRNAPACTPIAVSPSSISASSHEAGAPATQVFDGNTCTGWRSLGAPPQALTFTLCKGSSCAKLPALGAVGMVVGGLVDGSVTVELQGATASGAPRNSFYTMASKSFRSGFHDNEYIEMKVADDVPEVMRVVFNSGPPTAVSVRELVLLSCP